MDDFASLAKELERFGVPHEMITYGGAPHAFTVFGTDRYREGADQKSWRRFTGFLNETVKRPVTGSSSATATGRNRPSRPQW